VICILFLVEVEVLVLWECKCGVEALFVDFEWFEIKLIKSARIYWDMLLERCSIVELEVLFEECFALLWVKQ